MLSAILGLNTTSARTRVVYLTCFKFVSKNVVLLDVTFFSYLIHVKFIHKVCFVIETVFLFWFFTLVESK